MKFEDKLRQIRKEQGITQEELADLLDVSRQAVTKWESGQGYPETSKLILMSEKLNVSIDYLLKEEPLESKSADKIVISHGNGILIQDHEKKHMITCYSVKASKVLFTGKNEPKYALTGSESSSFWKPNDIILGWYKDLESVQLEIDRIMAAKENKESTYKLIHNSKVKMSGFFGQPKLVSEK